MLWLDIVDEIQTRLEAIMRSYWKGWTRGDAKKRTALRNAAARALPPPGWLLRAVQSTKGPFIETEDFFKEWP